MLTLEQTRDIKLLDGILHHADVWRGVKDDSSPDDLTLKSVVDNENNLFLLVGIDGNLVGFMGFLDLGNGIYEMHTNFTRSCRGKEAIDAAWTVIAWVFRNLPAERLVTYAFSTARPALLMMRVAGWNHTGIEPHPVPVDGVNVNRVWFELERKDWEERLK